MPRARRRSPDLAVRPTEGLRLALQVGPWPLARRSPLRRALRIAPNYTIAMERYRFHLDGALFYVTFSVVEWLPIFVSEAACKIVTESLNFCHERKGLRTNAYVIMPTHLHAIVFHETFVAVPLEAALNDFRK